MATSQTFKFDGGNDVGGYFGVALLSWILTIITGGLALPWAICMRQRWIAQHTIILDRRAKFIGTGGELFGKYIVWFLLTAITLGIYSFWVGPKMQEWISSNYDLD